jgi:hypothetical protein
MTTAIDQVVVRAVESVVGNKQETEAHSDLVQLPDGNVVTRLTKQIQLHGRPS